MGMHLKWCTSCKWTACWTFWRSLKATQVKHPSGCWQFGQRCFPGPDLCFGPTKDSPVGTTTNPLQWSSDWTHSWLGWAACRPGCQLKIPTFKTDITAVAQCCGDTLTAQRPPDCVVVGLPDVLTEPVASVVVVVAEVIAVDASLAAGELAVVPEVVFMVAVWGSTVVFVVGVWGSTLLFVVEIWAVVFLGNDVAGEMVVSAWVMVRFWLGVVNNGTV